MISSSKFGICLLPFCTFFLEISGSKGNPFQTNESQLFEDLFVNSGYDRGIRPVKNKSKPIQLSLDVALVQLIDLDDKEQNLKTNLWIRQRWTNELLRWNPEDYGGITSLVVDKKFIWTPDIVLYNNAKNGKHGGSIDQFKTRVDIHSDGSHKWYIPAILTSSCSIDITYFPFDMQICPLKFGSWTYLSGGINLTNYRDTADLTAYLPSSSFYLRKAASIRHVVKYQCCADPYIDVTFELVLERQPGFYVYNIILPAIVVMVFSLMNFMLPDVTGSRMGLVFDCFLAITVTYMMVGDKMPVSSDTVPIVAKLMLFCMSMMVLTVVTSAVSMRLRIDKPMPTIIRSVVIGVLGPLMFVTKTPCLSRFSCMQPKKKSVKSDHQDETLPKFPKERRRLHLASRNQREREEMEMFDFAKDSSSSGYPETSDSSCCGEAYETTLLWDQHFSSGFSSLDSPKSASKPDQECLRNITSLIDEQNRRIEDANTKDFWRCVSQIADRLFLMSFIFVWIIIVIALFLNTPKFDAFIENV